MATITGLTSERMLEIEAASVVDGEVVGSNLILTKHDGTTINAGPVTGPAGPAGPPGPATVSAIPGEVKMWPTDVLPDPAQYGKWVWADGAVYLVATYPKAAANIHTRWRTFDGLSDPGAANFRVPDLRGLSPVGLDQMPGGGMPRANRMTRAVAITIASKTGKETHVVLVSEMPSHAHGGATGGGMSGAADRSLQGSTDAQGNHAHSGSGGQPFTFSSAPTTYRFQTVASGGSLYQMIAGVQNTDAQGNHAHTVYTPDHLHSVPALGISAEGGNAAHENVQPTVMVPYICKLDG